MTLTTRLRPLSALVCALPLVLGACGGGSVDPEKATNEGYAALGSGDAEKALDLFVGALAGLKPTDALYERARMGEIEAKVHVAPAAASASFLEYAASQPAQVDAADYRKVGIQLSEQNALGDAVTVLDAGLKRFVGDVKLKEAIELTMLAAEKSSDSGALDKLRGLGYISVGD